MHKIIVYSVPTCSHCIQLKAYLKEQGVDFTNFDVSSDKSSLGKMVSLSGQMGVPVIDIDGQIVVGFDKDKIEELLA